MEKWIDDHIGTIIEYRKITKNKVSEYYNDGPGWSVNYTEDQQKQYGILQDAINLGDGEWLLGFIDIINNEGNYYAIRAIHYHPLNRISIYVYSKDQEIKEQINYLDEFC